MVTGFYRSGTTFLMESLARSAGLRSVFEPLCHQVRSTATLYRRVQGAITPEILPIQEPGAEPGALIGPFLEGALKGNVVESWTRNGRPACSYLRRKLLVKSVRMNGVVNYLKHHHGCSTVLLLRHPLAVASSVSRLPRMRRVLLDEDHLDFILEDPGKLDMPCREALERCRDNPWKRLAFLQALATYLPLKWSLLHPNSAPLVVRFEELALRYEVTMRNLLTELGYPGRAVSVPVNSWTTWGNEKKGLLHRCYGWEERLDSTAVAAIEGTYRGLHSLLDGQWEEMEKLRRSLCGRMHDAYLG